MKYAVWFGAVALWLSPGIVAEPAPSSRALKALMSLNQERSSLPKDYLSLSADRKLQLQWDLATKAPYSDEAIHSPELNAPVAPPPFPSPEDKPEDRAAKAKIVGAFLAGAFLNLSDEMPQGRKKFIHTYGAAAKAELRITEAGKKSGYTGIFQSGAKHVVIRLSEARPQNPVYVPGLGVKIYVDGGPSLNVFVMQQLTGQGADRNPFSNTFANELPPVPKAPENAPKEVKEGLARLAGLEAIFGLGLSVLNQALPGSSSHSASFIPVDGLALVDEKGKLTEGVVKAPWKLTFVPNPKVTALFDSKDAEDTRIRLQKTLPGSKGEIVLYTLYGQPEGEAKRAVEIAELVQVSNWVSSQYIDEKLYFRHGLFESGERAVREEAAVRLSQK